MDQIILGSKILSLKVLGSAGPTSMKPSVCVFCIGAPFWGGVFEGCVPHSDGLWS